MKRCPWILLAFAACGDNKLLPDAQAPVDEIVVDMPPDANPLDHVQGTGLCDDAACMTINADIHEYEPQFPLFSDGATKRRWMFLPTGTQIDTSDMDHWVFPLGTKFWKEFARDGTRVETRFMTKVKDDDEDPNGWFFISYVWNATQDDTVATTNGQPDANGTMHDVPSRSNCRECHNGVKPSRVLGFQAIQLDHATPSNLLDLDDLITGSLLTNPPSETTPHFPFPGNDVDKAALGYFHANCGHCHNPTNAGVHDIVPIELRLEVGKMGSVAATPAFKTVVFHPADDCAAITPDDDDNDGVADNGCARQSFTDNSINYDKLIIPQNQALSGLLIRTQLILTNKKMPKLATETMDPDGQIAIKAWIDQLTP